MDFENATLALPILPLRIQDVTLFPKNINFNTINEMPVSAINAIPHEFNGYPNFNKT